MHRLDEPIDVRCTDEVPSEFLWRGRLWQVRGVVTHPAEAGPWWATASVRSVVGSEGSSRQAIEEAARAPLGSSRALATLDDLLPEVEVWRVEAHCPRRQARPPMGIEEPGSGVFDLELTWATGCWRLTGCVR